MMITQTVFDMLFFVFVGNLSHCCRRTKLYHTLMHYKIRLMLKVQDKLRFCEFDIDSVLNSSKFLDEEYKRYTSLIAQVNNIYNNANILDHQIVSRLKNFFLGNKVVIFCFDFLLFV